MQILDLSNNLIGDDGAIALAFSLEQCKNLKKCDVSGNYIRKGGITFLFKHLSFKVNFSRRDIFFNDSVIAAGDSVQAIARNLEQCSILNFLDLSGIGIDDNGATIIATGLKSCDSLKTLYFSYNFISDLGVEALTTCVQSFHSLQTLYLDRNMIGDEGAKAIANRIIPYCTNLHTLNLDCNVIGENGEKELARHMKNSTSLQELSLEFNLIGYSEAA